MTRHRQRGEKERTVSTKEKEKALVKEKKKNKDDKKRSVAMVKEKPPRIEGRHLNLGFEREDV